MLIEIRFWLKFRSELNPNKVILRDPAGFTFNVSISIDRCNRAGFVYGVENIIRRYNLKESYWVLCTYKGNSEFDIRLVTGSLEVNYPRVERDADVDDNAVEYEEDPKEDEDDSEEPIFLWEVTLTAPAASGSNALVGDKIRFYTDDSMKTVSAVVDRT
ncbi:DNA-binding barrel domain superfamily [Sesbania bispinosa]|nr:DNA-binding barrel domain superfamily [Sesbania bispinosa]